MTKPESDIVLFTPATDSADFQNPAFRRAVEAANNLSLYYQHFTKAMIENKIGVREVGGADLPILSDDGLALFKKGPQCDPEWGLAAYKIFSANIDNFYCQNPSYAAVFAPDGYQVVNCPDRSFDAADAYHASARSRAEKTLSLLNHYAGKPNPPAPPRFVM